MKCVPQKEKRFQNPGTWAGSWCLESPCARPFPARGPLGQGRAQVEISSEAWPSMEALSRPPSRIWPVRSHLQDQARPTAAGGREAAWPGQWAAGKRVKRGGHPGWGRGGAPGAPVGEMAPGTPLDIQGRRLRRAEQAGATTSGGAVLRCGRFCCFRRADLSWGPLRGRRWAGAAGATRGHSGATCCLQGEADGFEGRPVGLPALGQHTTSPCCQSCPPSGTVAPSVSLAGSEG